MNRAIVLVSGGMDSCVTAAIASQSNELYFLHVNYGQRTEKREMKAFDDIADFYNVQKRMAVDISHLKKIGGSSLTQFDMPVLLSDQQELSSTIPNTYVPFRNANILSIAVSWAEVISADKIYIGAVEEDSSGYPDCRKEFYTAFNNLLKVGLHPDSHVQIETPLINLKKEEIVTLGMKLKAPLEMSWSCYTNEDFACGKCESCLLRLKGFNLSGYKDPIPYIEY